MNNEQLERLLRNAAADDAVPGVADDLASRVRQRLVHRRKQRRIVTGSTGMILLVAFLGIWYMADQSRRVGTAHQNPATSSTSTTNSGAPLRSAPATQDTPDAIALQAEIKQLREEIAQLRAQIKEDEARRRFQKQLAALRRELRKPSPRDLALAKIEETAFLLVHRAKACETQNRSDEARQEYEQVVRLFPNTSSAKVAQAILAKNFPPKGINP